MKKNKKGIEEKIAVGRRKTAVAAVRMRRGTGKVLINGKKLEKYFPSETHKNIILSPIEITKDVKDYDLVIRLKGGGIEAQAIAIRLGVSRAIVKYDETVRQKLKNLGYLTRDPRKKERKKYGLAGARKSFQFSKR